MRMADAATSPAPWYREPLVWMLIAIPGSAVLVGMLLLTLAIRSYDGLVVDDYYARGKQINQSLQRDRAAARHGLSASLNVHAGGIALTLAGDSNFEPPAILSLGLYHATRGGHDRELTLVRSQDQVYRADLAPLPAGAWELQLASGDWRLTGRLHAPGESDVRMVPVVPAGNPP